MMRKLLLLASPALLCLLLVAVSYPELFEGSVSMEAGDAPIHQASQIAKTLADGHFSCGNTAVGLGSIGPIIVGDYTSLCYWLLPAEKVEESLMAIGVFCAAFFFFLFLRARGLGFFPALIGGVSFGFCTVLLSISKAGHTGKFSGIGCITVALWMMQRMLNDRKWIWGAFAGLFVGYAFAQAKDFALIIMLGVAALWIMDAVRMWRVDRLGAYRALAMYIVAAIVAILVMWPVISILVPSSAQDAAKAVAPSKEVRGYAWATQWSLPSEELPKLVIPSYCGYDSWHASAPYWGRMGRSEGWDSTKQGFRNFTQTNEYLGVSVFLLALIGVAGGLLRRIKKRQGQAGERIDDVAFWLVLGFISLIMALGKYGFLYRLFYELPMMSSIRNPVKFMHLVSLSVSILCAHGVEDILLFFKRKDFKWSHALPAIVPAVGLMCILLLVLVAAPWDSKELAQRLAADGFAAKLEGIRGEMFKGVLRSIWFTFLVTVSIACVVFTAKALKAYAGLVCAVLLLATVAWDLTGVNRRYVSYYNPASVYSSNVVMDYLKDSNPFRTKFIPHNQGVFNMWNSLLVPYLFVKSADVPAESRRSPDLQAFYEALSRTPARMWNLMGVRNIVVPRQYVSQLQQIFDGSLTITKSFDLQQKRGAGGVEPFWQMNSAASQFVILENQLALPCPAWFANAEYVDIRGMPARLSDPTFDIRSTILLEHAAVTEVVSPGEAGQGSADIELKKCNENETSVAVKSDRDGWLLFNDYDDGRWQAFVDGSPVEIFKANVIFKAVKLPAGKHEVSVLYSGSELSFWMPVGILAGLILLLAFTLIYGRLRQGAVSVESHHV